MEIIPIKAIVKAIPGKTYTATFWAKASTGSPTLAVNLHNTTILTPALTTTYTQYSVTFIAPSTTDLVFKRASATSNSLYIDDISVTEVSPLVGLPVNGVTLGATASGHLTNAYSFNGTNNNCSIISSIAADRSHYFTCFR